MDVGRDDEVDRESDEEGDEGDEGDEGFDDSRNEQDDIMEISNYDHGDGVENNSINSTSIGGVGGSSSQASTDNIIRPVLRGHLTCENAMTICRGVWAYNDAQHDANDPALVNEFQFRRVEALHSEAVFPRDASGKYLGWFRVPRMDAVEEKDLHMIFAPLADGTTGNFSIGGTGSNRFGHFTLTGTLDSNNSLRVVREYVHISRPRQKKSSHSADAPITPRENTGRVRKASSLLVFQDEFGGGLLKNSAKRKGIDSRGCMDVLLHLKALPQAHWFIEPVNPITYPEYFTIISEPMDFGTILNNLRVQGYTTNEAFESHVKLVFKNAITFNVMRDNPVHIAAKELSKLFDDLMRARGLKTFKSKEKKNVNRGGYANQQINSGMDASGMQRGGQFEEGRKSRSYGPNARASQFADPQVQEMHEKMMEMQRELSRLRNVAGVKDPDAVIAVKPRLATQKDWDSIPLSLEAKEQLIERIYALPEANMNRLVQIVQEAMPDGELANLPSSEDDKHYELSLDKIDAYTQHRLLAYVEVRY